MYLIDLLVLLHLLPLEEGGEVKSGHLNAWEASMAPGAFPRAPRAVGGLTQGVLILPFLEAEGCMTSQQHLSTEHWVQIPHPPLN